MFHDLPNSLLRHRRWVALAAILLSLLTWTVDLTELVYACPYCRVQRTAIGLLGLLLLVPDPSHWLARYLSAVLAVSACRSPAPSIFRGWAGDHVERVQLGRAMVCQRMGAVGLCAVHHHRIAAADLAMAASAGRSGGGGAESSRAGVSRGELDQIPAIAVEIEEHRDLAVVWSAGGRTHSTPAAVKAA